LNDIPELDGPEIGPAGGGAPEQLIVFVHGYGADGNDLIGLAPQFADLLPNAKFVAPNAPYPCEAGPFGYQWFRLTERTEPEMLAGARTAQPILNQFIGTQLSRAGLQDRNLALIGFSQGTMISLFTGLRRERPMAGILGYSGRLVGAEALGCGHADPGGCPDGGAQRAGKRRRAGGRPYPARPWPLHRRSRARNRAALPGAHIRACVAVNENGAGRGRGCIIAGAGYDLAKSEGIGELRNVCGAG